MSTAAITIVCCSTAACKRSAAEEKGNTQAPPVSVKTVAVTEVSAPVTLRLSGNLKGLRETDLAANATGRVLSTSVERGAQVKIGQVLAQLDVRAAAISATEMNAQAESARASAAQLKAECARSEQLKASGSISAAELERITAQCRTSTLGVEASTARAQMAAQNVGDGSVRAPFAGVVTERYVDVGEYVRPDSRVVTIVSIDTLRLELAVPEAEAGKVSEDSEVVFHVAAFPERRFTGKVRFVSGAIRAATRDLVVEGAGRQRRQGAQARHVRGHRAEHRHAEARRRPEGRHPREGRPLCARSSSSTVASRSACCPRCPRSPAAFPS